MTVRLSVERGGLGRDVNLMIGDLHDITPDRYVIACGAIFHPLSYHMAMEHQIPVQGVVYVGPSIIPGAFFPGLCQPALIKSVDQKEIANLTDFVEAMKNIPGEETFSCFSN